MSEERLDLALEALRQETAGRKAPARVGRAVMTELRRRQAGRQRRTRLWFSLAAAAACVVAALLVRPAPRPQLPPAPLAVETQVLVTPFFPLAPWKQEDGARVIRMQVPAAALAAYGVPVNQEVLSERVPADVLVADDGTARAVRLVRYQ